jgi:hypothetical protein
MRELKSMVRLSSARVFLILPLIVTALVASIQVPVSAGLTAYHNCCDFDGRGDSSCEDFLASQTYHCTQQDDCYYANTQVFIWLSCCYWENHTCGTSRGSGQ